MINGFTIDIINNTSTEKEVKLFTNSLPEGVSVNTMDKAYNFDDLHKIAQKNVFIGNSISTGFEEGIQIEIVSKGKVEKITLTGRYETPEISINGFDEYVLVTCPANSNFYIRLSMLISE